MFFEDHELISLLYQTIARGFLRLVDVSNDLGVAPETISRWKKNGKLGRRNREAIAAWLASRGVDLEAEFLKKSVQLLQSSRSAEQPPDRFLQVVLESWQWLPISERAKVAALAADLLEKSGHGTQPGRMDGDCPESKAN